MHGVMSLLEIGCIHLGLSLVLPMCGSWCHAGRAHIVAAELEEGKCLVLEPIVEI